MTKMKTLMSGVAALALLTTPVLAETSANVSADTDASVSAADQNVGTDTSVAADTTAKTDTENAADSAGAQIKKSAEATGEAVEDGVENTADAVGDTADTAVDKTQEMAADVGDDVAPTTMKVSELEGSDVKASNGDIIGEIDNIVLINGKEMAVIGIGGFLGIGEHNVALPLADLSSDGTDFWAEGYTKTELEAMAEYDDESATEVNDDEPVMLGKS